MNFKRIMRAPKFNAIFIAGLSIVLLVSIISVPKVHAGIISEGLKQVGKGIARIVTRNDDATKVVIKKSSKRVSPAKPKPSGDPKVTIKQGQTVKVKKSQTVSLKKGQKPTMSRTQADDIIVRTKKSTTPASQVSDPGKLWWQQNPPAEFVNAVTNRALHLRDDIVALKKKLPKRDRSGNYVAKKTDDVEVKIKPKSSADGREVIVVAKDGGKAQATTRLKIKASDLPGQAVVKRGGKSVTVNVAKEPRTRTFIDADGAVRRLVIKPDGSIYINGSYMGKGAKAAKRIEADLAKAAKMKKPPTKQLTAGDRQLLLEAGEQASTANKWLTKNNIGLVAATSIALFAINEHTNGGGDEAVSKLNKLDELNGTSKALLAERKELVAQAKKQKAKAPSTKLPSTVYAKGTSSIVFNNSDLVGSVNPRLSDPKLKNAPPSGNIVVITYVDRERVDTAGNYDGRLGNVQVKVKRKSGDNGCSNRKKADGKTNGLRYHPKDKSIIVKGTINYRNCNPGTYDVDLVGRSGYVAVGKKSDTCKINDDQTCVIKFVLKKATDPDPVIDTETAPEEGA